jgi:multidrug transporter EmrE-like cation transporter
MDPLTILVDDSAFRYAVLMGIIETGADGALKAYATTNNPNYLATTLAGYSSLLYVFQRALRNEKLGRVNAFWNAFTTVSNVGMGMAMGETYTGTQLLGFGLISAGIFMI